MSDDPFPLPSKTADFPASSSGNDKLIRFAIWDLILITTFVAIVFALPLLIQQMLLTVSLIVLTVTAPALITLWPSTIRMRKSAVLARLIVPFVLRIVLYAGIIFALTGIALVSAVKFDKAADIIVF